MGCPIKLAFMELGGWPRHQHQQAGQEVLRRLPGAHTAQADALALWIRAGAHESRGLW